MFQTRAFAGEEESYMMPIIGADLRRHLEIAFARRRATSSTTVPNIRLHVNPLSRATGIPGEKCTLGMLRLKFEIA